MTSISDSTLGNDEAQHEALVHKVEKPKSDISTVALIWKPATLGFIPLAIMLISVFLVSSCIYYFKDIRSFKVMNEYGFDEQQPNKHWICFPNGTAVPASDSTTLPVVWDPTQFLDITLGFGSFQFDIAKSIDIGWDLIVGRGGQLFLAFLSYRIWSAVLLHSMETRAASFYTYTAIGFDRGPLFVVWASSRDLWARRSQGKGVLSMAIFASLYLLAFPTFVSTMTGYKPNYSPWVYLRDEDAMYPAGENFAGGDVDKRWFPHRTYRQLPSRVPQSVQLP